MPVTVPGRIGDATATIMISISPTTVFVNGDRVFELANTADVPTAIEKALPRPATNAQVIIAADKTIQYSVVVAVLDGVKRAAYTRIALATAPP